MIPLKTAGQLKLMRQSGAIAAQVADIVRAGVAPGVTTGELDRQAEAAIRRLGGKPGFKGLYGFPGTACISVNEEVVHGVPGQRRLCEGDIVGVDLGVIFRGWWADITLTIPVGVIGPQAAALLQATELALADAIAACKPGGHLGDIGAAVQLRAGSAGCTVVREYGGHGIGAQCHEEPWIANYGLRATGPELRPGMTFALEPMLNLGTGDVKTVDVGGWPVVVTADGALSAHFEHTVAVTEDGPVILTSRDE